MVDMLLGLFGPFRHEIPDYLDYNIKRFKDHFRVMEVIANREGEASAMVPLWFDGATNSFDELPRPPWTVGTRQPNMNCDSCECCTYKDACDLKQYYESSETFDQMNNLIHKEWRKRKRTRWLSALVSRISGRRATRS